MFARSLGSLIVLGVASVLFCPEEPSAAQDQTVLPSGKIVGVVRGADGKAEAALVDLSQYTLGRHYASVKADASGKFAANALPLGRYYLSIRGELVDDVELTPGEPSATVTLQAPPWAILRGVVRDKATRQPIAGAIVMANLMSPSQLTFKAVDMGDRFDWSRYTAAQLVARARREQKPFALTDAEGRYEMKLGDEHGLFFAVGPNLELFPKGHELAEDVRGIKELDFALERRELYRVHGRVMLEDGQPFARGKARFFMRRDPHRFVDVVTDAEGRYAFYPDYHLSSLVWMQVEGYSIMHQYAPLDKPPPFPAVDWVLKRSQKGTLKVTVARADGKPIPDATDFGGWRDGEQVDAPKPGTPGPHIYYREEADRWGRSGLSVDLSGGKGERDMDPGSYAFALRSFPLTGAPKEQRRDLVRDLSSAGERGDIKFSIQPGKATELKVTAALPSALTIVVTDEAGVPVSGVNVAAFRWNDDTRNYAGTWGTTATDDKGAVLLDPVTPGRYVFHPATGGTDFEPLRRYAIKLEAGKHERLNMVVSRDDLQLLRKRTAARYDLKLEGQVLMPDGVTPAAQAAIYIDHVEGQPHSHADADGKFSIANRSTGTLTLSARSHGTALTSATSVLGTDDPPPLRVVLRKAATIHGRVLNADGTAATDVRLWLGQPEMSEPSSWGGPYGRGGSTLTTPVRRDGTFTLHGVAPGKQHLCVYRNGALQINRVRTLDITEGEERKGVELTVEPERPLEIHFRRADGTPMPRSYEARLHSDFSALSCGGMEERGDIARSKGALPSGRYHLWLESANWAKRDLDILPSLIVRNINLEPGTNAQRLDITVPVGGAIKGRVTLADGTPAAALRVAVHAPASSESDAYLPMTLLREANGPPSYAEANVDPDGHYQLFGLAPGRYRLNVRWRGKAQSLFVSEPLEVKSAQTTAAGTWTVGRRAPAPGKGVNQE